MVAAERGDIALAEGRYREALEIFRREDPPQAANCLNSLGELALKGGSRLLAENYFGQALQIANDIAPAGRTTCAVLMNLGRAALERHDVPNAEILYNRALLYFQRAAPGSADEAQALYGLGLTARQRGDRLAALDYLRRAVDATERQKGRLGGSEESQSDFGAKFANYYRDYIESLKELHRDDDAFGVLERFRARSFLYLLAERDLVFSSDVPFELDKERKQADFEYDQAQSNVRELNPNDKAKEIDEGLTRLGGLRQKQAEIAERIKKTSPKYAALQYPQPLDLARTRAALDPGTQLLSYSVGKEKSYLFVVSPEPKRGPPLSVFTLSVGERALRESVQAFRRLIEWNKPSSDLVSRSRSLYDTLVRPAEALIGKNDRLLILPDGPLHTLPWAALVRDVKAGKPQYLVEWKPIHTAVSATVYAELKKSRHEGRNDPAIQVAAFGDPRYPALVTQRTVVKRGDGTEEVEEETYGDPQINAVLRGGYKFEPLPASRKEVEQITALYAPKVAAYLGSDATEEKAKAIGKDVPLIHYACHAVVNERFPLDSALVFSIPERPKEGQDNGLLQAWEIFEKVRIDADLVTLSACESGLGKEMGGEGLIGLTRAFQYAGARSVLASLWKVEDQSTGELMKRFYQYLKAGKTKDEALRLAQIDLIHSPNLSQPKDWAAFELIGDWK